MRVRSGAEVNDVLLINNSGVQGLPGDEGAWTATGMGPMSRAKAGRIRGPRSWMPAPRGCLPVRAEFRGQFPADSYQPRKSAVARRLMHEMDRNRAVGGPSETSPTNQDSTFSLVGLVSLGPPYKY